MCRWQGDERREEEMQMRASGRKRASRPGSRSLSASRRAFCSGAKFGGLRPHGAWERTGRPRDGHGRRGSEPQVPPSGALRRRYLAAALLPRTAATVSELAAKHGVRQMTDVHESWGVPGRVGSLGASLKAPSAPTAPPPLRDRLRLKGAREPKGAPLVRAAPQPVPPRLLLGAVVAAGRGGGVRGGERPGAALREAHTRRAHVAQQAAAFMHAPAPQV